MEPKCRLCLSKEKLIWVFDPRIVNASKLSDIIRNATGVHISETDPVTQMVCHECCLYTVDIYKFRVKCIINNNLLLHSFEDRCDKKVKLEAPVVKDEPKQQQNSPTKKPRKEVSFGSLEPPHDHTYYRVRRPTDGARKQHEGNNNDENVANIDSTNANDTVEEENRERDKSANETLRENLSQGEDTSKTVGNSEETPAVAPNSHRLMLTRSKRRLKSDIEKRRVDKQRFIESLYAENIDKIMFTSYLKLAPKYEVVVPEISIYKENGMSCKLCKANVELRSTLREHLERDCEIFKMIDNLPTVNVVRIEDVGTLRDNYPGVVRQVRAVKKVRRLKCPCCDDNEA